MLKKEKRGAWGKDEASFPSKDGVQTPNRPQMAKFCSLASLVSSPLLPEVHPAHSDTDLLVHIALFFVYIPLLLLLPQERPLPQSFTEAAACDLQNQWLSGQLLWKASARWCHLTDPSFHQHYIITSSACGMLLSGSHDT